MITDKLRDDEDAAAIENDWKFAAMVLDRFVFMVAILALNMLAIPYLNMVTIFTLTMLLNRLCLITFTAFTVIATVAVLAAAPHVIVT